MQHSLQASGFRGPSSIAGAVSHPTAYARSQPCLQLQWIHALKQLKDPPARSSRRQQLLQRAQTQRQRQQHICQAALRPLEVSSSIAAARAAESSRRDALFQDPYAMTLCGQHSSSSDSSSSTQASRAAAMDVIATQYIDESLVNAMDATSINSIQAGDYRQVVLLGDGFDTRPFRLMWPPGTLLFSVAPAEVHEQAEARLAAATPPAHVQRGCLLRRVNMNIKPAIAAAATAIAEAAAAKSDSSSSSDSSAHPEWDPDVLLQQGSSATVFREQLSRAGFRADRLSVWVLQGLHDQGIGPEVLRQLLAEVADSAAFHSLIVGELPGPLTRQEADNLLAEAGLLGAVYDYATADGGQYKRWQHQEGRTDVQSANSSSSSSGTSGGSVGDGAVVGPRWIVTGQQLRLSLAQMGIYDEWSTEFEEADFGDDFIGNVS